MRIGDKISSAEYKALQEVNRELREANNSLKDTNRVLQENNRSLQNAAAQRAQTINSQRISLDSLNRTIDRVKRLLNLPFTESNLRNATDLLQSAPNYRELYKYVVLHIFHSAKSSGALAKIIKDKCTREGRVYKGFRNHPDWFVFQAFKEAAIKKNPTSFSFRFRDALIAFVLKQQSQSVNGANRPLNTPYNPPSPNTVRR